VYAVILMATIRSRNASKVFNIHEDAMREEEAEDDQETEESRGEEDEDDGRGKDYDSEESDSIVDPAVQEDMDKFQNTFKGIKERFRLINRIGEGMFRSISFLR
jgi:cell division control protein 7